MLSSIQQRHSETTIRSIAARPLSCAVIGGGKISEQHLGSLRTIEGVEVIGVCDLSPALARFTAERFQLPCWGTDYRQMLADHESDVVHVLTPPETHERIVRDCLIAGRHVIVEKPVALCTSVLQSLWQEARERDLWLIENHNYRFNSPIEQISQAIAAGRIGSVEEVEVRMSLAIRGGGRYADANLPHPSHCLPAGVIHEFISHLAYLLLHFMPPGSIDRIDSLRAHWRNHGGGAVFKYDDLDATLLAGTTHGRIRFSCRQWPDCFAVDVRGSRGIASAELFHPSVRMVTPTAGGKHLTPLVNSLRGAGSLTRSGLGSLWRKIRNRTAYEGLQRFLTLTYNALQTGQEPPVSFKQMNQTSRLIDALLAAENQV